MKVLIDGQTLATPEIERGIGRFFQEVCDRLIPRDLATEWLMTVKDERQLECFSPETRKRLRPVQVDMEASTQASFSEKTRDYSRLLEEIVLAEGIDAYWNPNPLMLNVVLPTGLSSIPVVLTVHDLIPLQFPDEYLSKWPETDSREYLRRIDAIGTWAAQVIFDSEYSLKSFNEQHPDSEAEFSVGYLGVDRKLFWPGYRKRDGSETILFVGGFDYRKNMENALRAFSLFTQNAEPEDREFHLFVVCSASDEERSRFIALAETLGVATKVFLTGRVADWELAELFRQSCLCFFPSRCEGFGLPVLEAMACGVPVVTGDVSSLPEVGGDLAYYCAPGDPEDIARALGEAVSDVCSEQIDSERLLAWASRFTWDQTAAHYSQILGKACHKKLSLRKGKIRVAWASPWPPQHSGIADYSFHLVRELSRYFEVTVFVDGEEGQFSCCDGIHFERLSRLESQFAQFDQIVYHIGNNVEFHKAIYLKALQIPGIVVLHDYNLHPFLKDAFLATSQEALYEDALVKGYGEAGKAHYREIRDDGVECDIWSFPMSHRLARSSSALIVHSNWVKQQFGGLENVFVVPLGGALPTEVPTQSDLEEFRKVCNLKPGEFLISSLGYVNRLKRVHTMLDATVRLREEGYPVKLVLAGGLADGSLDLGSEIRNRKLEGIVTVTGYLAERDFEACIASSELILNLRYPSMGESSAALITALSRSKPCIVSNYNQFSELPDSVCWKVNPGESEVDEVVALARALLRDPALGAQLGRNARQFIHDYESCEIAAVLYARVIRSMS